MFSFFCKESVKKYRRILENYRNVVPISLTSYGRSSWSECHSCHRNNPIAQSRWPCEQRRPDSIHRDWHYKHRQILGRDPMEAYSLHQFIRGKNIVYVFIQNCDPNINLLFMTYLLIIGVLIFDKYWSNLSLPILHVPSGSKFSLIWKNFRSGKKFKFWLWIVEVFFQIWFGYWLICCFLTLFPRLHSLFGFISRCLINDKLLLNLSITNF